MQIDTINVIERCHHHILFSRIPSYRRADLRHAQSSDKSVFEFWTHALAYVPSEDLRFFIADMKDYKQYKRNPGRWFKSVTPKDLRKVLRLVKRDGALTIRDIEDDVLQDKAHLWASRKPSQAGAEIRVLHRRAGGQRAQRHAEDLRPDDATFRLGQAAEGRVRRRDHGLSAGPGLARARHRQPRFDLPPRRAAKGCGGAS